MSEIEALITEEEERNQTELNFIKEDNESEDMKLNIADGTFNPEDDEGKVSENINSDDREGQIESEDNDNPDAEVSDDNDSVVIDVDQT
jgi:hypothetical protein